MDDSSSSGSSRSHSPHSWEVEEENDSASLLPPLPLDLPSLSTAAFPASRPTELFKSNVDLPLLPAKLSSAASQHTDSHETERSTTHQPLRSARNTIIKTRSSRSKRPQIVAAESISSIKASIFTPMIEEEQARPAPRTMLDQSQVHPVPVARMRGRDSRVYDGYERVDDTVARPNHLTVVREGMGETAEGMERTEIVGYGRAIGSHPRANEGYPEGYLQAYDEKASRPDRAQSSWTEHPNEKAAKGQGWKQFRSREDLSEPLTRE